MSIRLTLKGSKAHLVIEALCTFLPMDRLRQPWRLEAGEVGYVRASHSPRDVLQLYVPLQFENRVYPLEIERDTGMMMVKMKGLMTRLAQTAIDWALRLSM